MIDVLDRLDNGAAVPEAPFHLDEPDIPRDEQN